MIQKSKRRKNNTKPYKTKTKITRKKNNSLKKEMMSISDLTEKFRKLKTSPSTPTAELVQSAKKINDEQTIFYNYDTNQYFILELQKRGQNYIHMYKNK